MLLLNKLSALCLSHEPNCSIVLRLKQLNLRGQQQGMTVKWKSASLLYTHTHLGSPSLQKETDDELRSRHASKLAEKINPLHELCGKHTLAESNKKNISFYVRGNYGGRMETGRVLTDLLMVNWRLAVTCIHQR